MTALAPNPGVDDRSAPTDEVAPQLSGAKPSSAQDTARSGVAKKPYRPSSSDATPKPPAQGTVMPGHPTPPQPSPTAPTGQTGTGTPQALQALSSARARSVMPTAADLVSTRRSRSAARWAHLILLIVALVLSSVWFTRAQPIAEVEGRATAPWPEFDWGGVADGSYFAAVDAALTDQLDLKSVVVRASQRIMNTGDSAQISGPVFVGPTGIPFFADDFTLPCTQPFDIAAASAGIRALSQQAVANGKSLTVAIAPDKSSILTSALGENGKQLLSCSRDVQESTLAAWPEPSRQSVVTAWPALTAAAEANPTRIFQSGDSHWTIEGALVYSRVLMDNLIQRGIAPTSLRGAPEADRRADQISREGDLYRLLGTPRAQVLPIWAVEREGVSTAREITELESGNRVVHYTSRTIDQEELPLIPGKTVVIHDSFFSQMELLLAPYFEDLTVIHWGDAQPLKNISGELEFFDPHTELPAADHVILETVQRGWTERSQIFHVDSPLGRYLQEQTTTPRRVVPIISTAPNRD